MAKRKAKGNSGVISRPKVAPSVKSGKTTNKAVPVGIIIAASLILIVVIAFQFSSNSNQNSGTNNASIQNNTPTAPPMKGVESFSAGQVDASKAQLVTFKLEELGGTDCAQRITSELNKLGGCGSIRADYTNTLLEVQCDPTKVTNAQIIAVLNDKNKADHPGQVTTEKIATQ